MNREEAAGVLSVMRYKLGYVGLIANEVERTAALDVAINYLLAEDNNAPVKQPDTITGLAPCGCGGVTEQTDFHDGFFPYSKVECLECGDEIMRAGDTIAEAHDMATIGWNASHGYTAPPRPGAKEQSYES